MCLFRHLPHAGSSSRVRSNAHACVPMSGTGMRAIQDLGHTNIVAPRVSFAGAVTDFYQPRSRFGDVCFVRQLSRNASKINITPTTTTSPHALEFDIDYDPPSISPAPACWNRCSARGLFERCLYSDYCFLGNVDTCCVL